MHRDSGTRQTSYMVDVDYSEQRLLRQAVTSLRRPGALDCQLGIRPDRYAPLFSLHCSCPQPSTSPKWLVNPQQLAARSRSALPCWRMPDRRPRHTRDPRAAAMTEAELIEIRSSASRICAFLATTHDGAVLVTRLPPTWSSSARGCIWRASAIPRRAACTRKRHWGDHAHAPA